MKEVFGRTKQGDVVTSYTITNKTGMSATIIDYGAPVVKLLIPDRHGSLRDGQLGYDDVQSYEEGSTFFGTIIGRNANRICGGQVTIDGVKYQMDQNDNENNLHSGLNGIDKKMWTVLALSDSSVSFICKSDDMEQKLPGDLTITVTYSISDDNEFIYICNYLFPFSCLFFHLFYIHYFMTCFVIYLRARTLSCLLPYS